MSGINTGILTNAYPLSTERIKELEKQVLENQETFAYLDENSMLCFSMPWGIDCIKDLAWHNAYELTKATDLLTKKVYKKRSLNSFYLNEILQKQPTEESWSSSGYTMAVIKAADGYQLISADGYRITALAPTDN